MVQLFDTIDVTKMTLEIDWEATYDEISINMEKLQEMLSSNIQKKYFYQNNRLMKFIGDNEININHESNEDFFFKDFKTNPIELLKESDDILIEEKSFDFNFYKSNLSCSFLSNEKSFMVWAGYAKKYGSGKNIITSYPLIIYNLSEKKKETMLQLENQFPITFVSIYPKDKDDNRAIEIIFIKNGYIVETRQGF